MHSENIPYESNNRNEMEMNDMQDLEEDDTIPIEYVPLIAAFRRSNNIIYDACGS